MKYQRVFTYLAITIILLVIVNSVINDKNKTVAENQCNALKTPSHFFNGDFYTDSDIKGRFIKVIPIDENRKVSVIKINNNLMLPSFSDNNYIAVTPILTTLINNHPTDVNVGDVIEYNNKIKRVVRIVDIYENEKVTFRTNYTFYLVVKGDNEAITLNQNGYINGENVKFEDVKNKVVGVLF